MPLYEYRCAKCDYRFEVLFLRQADLPKKCPKCGASKPVKQFSAFAVNNKTADKCPGGSPSCDTCATGSCPYTDDE